MFNKSRRDRVSQALSAGWNVLLDGRLGGYANMSRDIELLKGAEGGVSNLRVYEWDGPWVSLGRFQDPQQDLLDANLIPWVIRPTGGKAVLHGHDLGVTIAAPLARDPNEGGESRSLKGIYRNLMSPLIAALIDLGQPAALGEDREFRTGVLRTSDCFRHISANDVIDPHTGRKLIGCAMRVTKSAVLAQCSIPVAMPLIDPARIYAHAHVAQPVAIKVGELSEAIVANVHKP
jgi:lipoate-protein ligase A